MKTIFKYLSAIFFNDRLLLITCKSAIVTLCLLLVAEISFCQRNAFHHTPDSMLYVYLGASSNYIDKHAFDVWTATNFNLTERYRTNFYIDLGGLYKGYDLGLTANIGPSFGNAGGYIGRRLTRKNSFISSWLNLEMGGFFGRFTNIMPVNYTLAPDQVGQQMELHYNAFYMGLALKNYFNFLQYNIKIGRTRIPVNTGFFVSANWQPGQRNWRYGYYTQDTVFNGVKIQNIPKLGKLQGTAGVFMGF